MNRRGLLLGLTGLLAAPALARAGSLMPVRPDAPMRFFIDGNTFHEVPFDPQQALLDRVNRLLRLVKEQEALISRHYWASQGYYEGQQWPAAVLRTLTTRTAPAPGN